MKKILFTFTAIFCFALVSNAQIALGVKTSLGVTLAPNETTYSGEVFDYINHEITYKGSNIVKSYGLFAQQKFGFLYGRAELSYSNYAQEYKVRSFVQFGQGSKTVYEKYDFIDFQLMAGVTHENIRLGVGPVAHILAGYTPALDFISGYSDNNRAITYGFTTALGLDAGRFHIDVRYENNFKTVGQHINYGTRDADFQAKPHVVNLTLGISI
ncbi:MAG: hypothetical protein ACI9P5_001584 [Saprospiraceae bacterium]|jgi:hypothetical protein